MRNFQAGAGIAASRVLLHRSGAAADETFFEPMKPSMRRAAAFIFVLFTTGCAMSLRSPHISDLRNNPGRWQDRTVSIDGVVTSSWGLPLVPFRFYKIDDGTGEMTVLSQNVRMPTRGA